MGGRLRVQNEFGQRKVPSESINPKSIYVIAIAGEGKTEDQYFDGIKENARKLNIPEIIQIERLDKKDDKDKKSHPEHVKDLLIERKADWKEHGYDPNELWMVVDRDPQNVKTKQLEEIIEICQEQGFNIAISAPTFELWLLLHIVDIKDYDKTVLIQNKKVGNSKGSKRFIETELSRLLGGYNKNNIKFERFIEGIETAIKRAKSIGSTNENLVQDNSLGTTVHILVEKILTTT